VSWAGLAPVARQSGPRQRKPSKGQGDVYLKTYCAQAANGTRNTDTFLGERLRRLTRRLGATKAMCAVGRSILVIIWHLLADPAARFTDLGTGWHDQQAGRDRKIAGHLRQLKALGLDVTVNPAAALKPNPADQARSPRSHGLLNHARVWLLILPVSAHGSGSGFGQGCRGGRRVVARAVNS
jgi:hypothetical protein